MSNEKWLLLAYCFLLMAVLLLVGLPVLSMVLGLIIGFAALALGFATPEHNPWGSALVGISKYMWKHWLIMLAASLALSIALVWALWKLRGRR